LGGKKAPKELSAMRVTVSIGGIKEFEMSKQKASGGKRRRLRESHDNEGRLGCKGRRKKSQGSRPAKNAESGLDWNSKDLSTGEGHGENATID